MCIRDSRINRRGSRNRSLFDFLIFLRCAPGRVFLQILPVYMSCTAPDTSRFSLDFLLISEIYYFEKSDILKQNCPLTAPQTSEKAYPRHIRASAYCCFLPDLTRFTASHCAGPKPRRRSCQKTILSY